jgi:hypothetical protein
MEIMHIPNPLPLAVNATPFDDPEWIFEIKHDGFRALAVIERGLCRFISRNKHKLYGLRDLVTAIAREVHAETAILDGELAVPDHHGRTVFASMMKRRHEARFFAFDLLSINSEDLRQLPLLTRKQRLRLILPARSPHVLYVDHTRSTGTELYRLASQLDLEGIVAKRANSSYENNERAPHWIKIKNPAYSQIGLVISDDLMMVYAPTPLLIEAGSQQENRPNAVIVGPPPLPVLREMGFGENGYSDQTIGLDLAKDMEIKPVLEDLQINPPQKFDLARTVRVFNAHIEFVDFNLVGASIARKTVRIPARLMGLAGDEATARLLRASFQVVDHADNLSGEHLEHDKKLIVRTFLKTLPEYGTAILRTQKEEFEKAVSKLRDDVDTFKNKILAELQTAMDNNRRSLQAALLPGLLNNPPREWRRTDGSAPSASVLEEWLQKDLISTFGTAEDLVGQMEVRVLYKAVTFESLKDPKFIKVAKKAFPSLRNILDESIAVESNSD